MVTCSFCGTSPASSPQDPSGSDDPPITWTSAVESGTRRWFCETCSRQHLRAMESKLDSEWW